MEKTKKDKLTKLEREFNKLEDELINNQLNEINNKKQKSRKRKTLSLKDLLTKNDTEIDKKQKANLLKYLFINHVITGSEIKDLVEEGKIDQTLYNEINTDPEVVELQDKIILDLTQKLLLWDCQQFLLTLLSEKFGELETRPKKLETTEQTEQLQESDQNSENQLKIEHSLRMRPAPPPISEDEITKLKNMDLEEIYKDVQEELKEYVLHYNPEQLDILTTKLVQRYHNMVCGYNQDNPSDGPQDKNRLLDIYFKDFFNSQISILMKNFHVVSINTTFKISALYRFFQNLLNSIIKLEENELEIRLDDEQFHDFLTSYNIMIKEKNLNELDIIVVEFMILGETHKIIVDYNYNLIDKSTNSFTQEKERNIITFDVRVEIV